MSSHVMHPQKSENPQNTKSSGCISSGLSVKIALEQITQQIYLGSEVVMLPFNLIGALVLWLFIYMRTSTSALNCRQLVVATT